MPAGDGTGPRGEGSLTGRGMGRCTGYAPGGYTTAPGRGGGLGFFGRRGGGRGFRNRFYDTGLTRWQRYPQTNMPEYASGQDQTDSLRRQVQVVADTIEQIALRVNQLLNRKAEKE